MIQAFTPRALLGVMLSAALATPALADGYGRRYDNYNNRYYGHDYGRHHNSGGKVAAGIIGGFILGALVASASKSEREKQVVVQQPAYAPPPVVYNAPVQYVPVPQPVYVQPAQPAYVQSYSYSQCYERTVTETTVSGRIVTYTDRVC